MSRRSIRRSASKSAWTRSSSVSGSRPHIILNADSGSGCSTQACVTACPANLFVVTSSGGIVFNYAQCFECGTCYLVCDTEGALTWTYPDGGHGVGYARG